MVIWNYSVNIQSDHLNCFRFLLKYSNQTGDGRTATTHIKRQLISGDNSYQATTHINLKKRQLISSYNSYQSKLISENENLQRKS